MKSVLFPSVYSFALPQMVTAVAREILFCETLLNIHKALCQRQLAELCMLHRHAILCRGTDCEIGGAGKDEGSAELILTGHVKCNLFVCII